MKICIFALLLFNIAGAAYTSNSSDSITLYNTTDKAMQCIIKDCNYTEDFRRMLLHKHSTYIIPAKQPEYHVYVTGFGPRCCKPGSLVYIIEKKISIHKGNHGETKDTTKIP